MPRIAVAVYLKGIAKSLKHDCYKSISAREASPGIKTMAQYLTNVQGYNNDLDDGSPRCFVIYAHAFLLW